MSEDTSQLVENSAGYFQGRVIAKLESIEGMQHAQQAAIALKADDKSLQAHIDADRVAYDNITKSFGDMANRQQQLSDDVMKIVGIGIVVSLIISVVGAAVLNHFFRV